MRRAESRAGVAELVDALDLGSSGESRGGSSPSARTNPVGVGIRTAPLDQVGGVTSH